MKYFKLDKEEKKILEDFERGLWKPISDKSEFVRYQKIASSFIKKNVAHK
jgi:predicted DNA binding CopG/RHH family protein